LRVAERLRRPERFALTRFRGSLMLRWNWLLAAVLTISVGLFALPALAENEGQKDLDEALRVKVTAENLRDLNKTVDLLESALDKGLDVENSDFAESMLRESLMERAGQLAAVVQNVAPQRLVEPSIQKVRALAVSDLKRILEYDNPPAQARLLLSQLLTLPGGDRPEALKQLNQLFDDKAVAEMPAEQRADALTLRATLQTDDAKALADFDEAVKLAPNESSHRMARAEFQRRREHFDEALADVEAILQKEPNEASAYLLKAGVLRDQKKLDDAIASLEKAIELAPTAPGPHQELGEIYREKGEIAKAIEQFNKVLQLQPGLVITLIHRAEAYLNNKQADEALVDIEAVLKENPELPTVRALRAQALASKERWPEAIAEMKSLADSQPAQLEYRMQLAVYYLLAKQPHKAIETYTDILDRDAKNQFALRGRADAYLTVGEHKKAVKDFEKAYATDSKDSSVLNNFAWVLATSPDDQVRDGKRAIEIAKKACELTEYKQTHILSTLAAAYAESGDFEKAREWSQKALDLFETQRPKREVDDGKEATEKLAKELGEELASYKTDKPWRERQTAEDEAKAKGDKSEAKPDATPATASAPAKPISL
jgi:tetratricopeptide (TPR) repeat protein